MADKVTQAQVEAATATLLQALGEGYSPQAMHAFLDTRFDPPIWKLLLPAEGQSYTPLPGRGHPRARRGPRLADGQSLAVLRSARLAGERPDQV